MTNHSMPCIRPSRACSLLRLRLLPQRRPRRRRSPMRRLLHRSMLPQAPIAPMRNSRFPLLPQHTRCIRPTSLRRSPSPRRLPWLLPQLLRLSLPPVPRPRRFPVRTLAAPPRLLRHSRHTNPQLRHRPRRCSRNSPWIWCRTIPLWPLSPTWLRFLRNFRRWMRRPSLPRCPALMHRMR